jgi:secondary thiamine-phosphate synthase enzyme
MIFHETLAVETSKQLEVLDLTVRVNKLLKTTHIDKGVLHLLVLHTTAALTINENDKEFWRDLLNMFFKLAPVKGDYHHKPNAHAHILSSIVKPDVTVPINNGRMVLGTWQRLLLLELDGPRERTIKVTIIGE